MSKNRYIVIMAGGVGSRFWPASTEELPKQFLDIIGTGQSLIQSTFERARYLVPIERILVLTNAKYKKLVCEHLPELPENNVLCEPSRNNTAPCICYCALHLNAINPNAVFAVWPSDHVIGKVDQFVLAMQTGFEKAEQSDVIITLGIQPSRPDTGYGYIEVDLQSKGNELSIPVTSFKEKPDLETARQYLAASNYYWNAGIFIWSIGTLLSSFEQNAPTILGVLNAHPSKFGTDQEQEYINEVYPGTTKISVDYAILEKSSNVAVIPADVGWSDLGTWTSLHDFLKEKDEQNVVQTNQYSLTEVSNTFIRSDADKIIVVKGLEGYVVIDEGGVLLIFPRGQEKEVQKIRKRFVG